MAKSQLRGKENGNKRPKYFTNSVTSIWFSNTYTSVLIVTSKGDIVMRNLWIVNY